MAENGQTAKVVDRLLKSQEYKSEFIQRCADYYRYYRGVFKNKVSGRAAIWVPYTLATVESQLPRFVGNRPRISFEADLPEYQKFTNSVNYKVENDWILGKMSRRIVDLAKITLLFGFCGCYVPWVERERWVRNRKPLSIFGLNLPYWIYAKEKEMIFEGPVGFPVSPWRLFWDPEGTSPENCGWMGHIERVSLAEIEAAIASKAWTPQGQEKAALERAMEKADKWDRCFAFHYYEDGVGRTLLYADFNQKVSLNFKKHGELQVEDFAQVAGDSGPWCTVWDQEAPFDDGQKPYAVCSNVPMIEEFEAMGDAELIAPQQKELNILRSTRLDNVNASINKMWIVHSSAKINPDELIFRPNGIINVRGMPIDQALKELTSSDIKGASLQEEEAIKADIHVATGQWETRMGQESSRNERTATALLQAQEAADVRIQMKVQLFEMDLLEPVGRMFLARNRQFLTEEIVRRRLGSRAQEYFEIGPEQLAGKYIPVVHGRSTEPYNRQLRMQEIVTLLNTLRAIPSLAERFDPGVLASMMAERFGVENVPGLVYSEKEVERRRAIARQAQQQMETGGGISGDDMLQLMQGGEQEQQVQEQVA
jgi:hypothetical protein